MADRDIANPYGAILSVALLLRHSLGLAHEAGCLETAVGKALDAGALTSDLAAGTTALGTHAVAAAVVERLQEHGYVSELLCWRTRHPPAGALPRASGLETSANSTHWTPRST